MHSSDLLRTSWLPRDLDGEALARRATLGGGSR
jgi:hypothetical protein